MSGEMLLLEIMLCRDSGGEEVAAAGEASSGSASLKLVFSRKTLHRNQGLALLGLCIWYLNLLGLEKYV